MDEPGAQIELEGFILAGGASRRMGRNKAVLRLGGKTFLERAADALFPISRTVRIVGDLRGETATLEVVPDMIPSDGGAVVGVLTALHSAESEWIAVLACDLPFVSGELMSRLASISAAESGYDCVVPLQPDGRLQALCAIYRAAACRQTAVDFHRLGGRRMQDLIGRLNARLVNFDEIRDIPGSSNFFLNVNTPSDLEEAAALIAATE